MALVQKKICMLGATAVGKTSLVRRFVESLFSEKYQATVGVKIDRKVVQAGDDSVSLLLWDLQGEDEMQRVRQSYLRGASGFVYVADGTRPATLDTVVELRELARETVGDVPSLLFLNKSDLAEQWALEQGALAMDGIADLPVIRTSALTGDQVEAGFQQLVEDMLRR